MKKLIAVTMMLAMAGVCAAQQSRWVYYGADGRLKYAYIKTGERIPDYSYAGYKGGGVLIPDVAERARVAPTGGDDTAAIQKAIDAVSKLPLVDGVRGAVVLGAGTFQCARPVRIAASGVVLRGAGGGKGGTTIYEAGDFHRGIEIQGALSVAGDGPQVGLDETYVPFGATEIRVKDGTKFKAGDTVLIVKQVTPQWVRAMGMDALERPGRNEHWITGDLEVRRRVVAVEGDTLRLEIALMDSYDARVTGGTTVQRVKVGGQVENVGVEDLRVEAPAHSGDLKDAHSYGMAMDDAADAWVRRVNFVETTEGVDVRDGSERVTLQLVDVSQTQFVTSSAKPFDFSIGGTQVLLDRCSGRGDRVFYVATQQKQQGPVVVLHGEFHGDGHLEPHQRWSTGMLVDSTKVPEGGIDFINSGTMGTGHGWTLGWGVSWNNEAGELTMEEAPGTLTWSIGDVGPQQKQQMPGAKGGGPEMPQGEIDSAGKHVRPGSLYLQQLKERLGAEAVWNLGYAAAP